MKALLILLTALSLSACGDDDGKKAADVPVCVEEAGPQQITYSDGVERKSIVTNCTYKSGRICTYAYWVSNRNVTFVECHGG